MPAPKLRRVAGRTRSPNADLIGPRFKELRAALGDNVKAADIGRRMGIETPTTPDAGRVLWTKIETGKNQASTSEVQEAVARALSVDVADVRALVRGELSPTELAKRAKLAPLPDAKPEADATPLARAVAAADLLGYPAEAVAAGARGVSATETASQIFDRMHKEAHRPKTKADKTFDDLGLPRSHDDAPVAAAKKQKSGG